MYFQYQRSAVPSKIRSMLLFQMSLQLCKTHKFLWHLHWGYCLVLFSSVKCPIGSFSLCSFLFSSLPPQWPLQASLLPAKQFSPALSLSTGSFPKVDLRNEPDPCTQRPTCISSCLMDISKLHTDFFRKTHRQTNPGLFLHNTINHLFLYNPFCF